MVDDLHIKVTSDDKEVDAIASKIKTLNVIAKNAKNEIKVLTKETKELIKTKTLKVKVETTGLKEAEAKIDAVTKKPRYTRVDIDIMHYKEQLRAMGRAESEIQRHNKRRKDLNEAFGVPTTKAAKKRHAEYARMIDDQERLEKSAARKRQIRIDKERKKELASIKEHRTRLKAVRSAAIERNGLKIQMQQRQESQSRAAMASWELLKISVHPGGRDRAAERRREADHLIEKAWARELEEYRRSEQTKTDEHRKSLQRKELKEKRARAIELNMLKEQIMRREEPQRLAEMANSNLFENQRRGGIDLAAKARSDRDDIMPDTVSHGTRLGDSVLSDEMEALTREFEESNKLAKKNLETPSARTARKLESRAEAEKAWLAGELSDEDKSLWAKENKKRFKKDQGNNQTSGSDGRIEQMPQNPLLGRFAQWGMMASGAAASIFLIQMIGAQLANLMDIITKWGDAISAVTENFVLTKDESAKMPKTIRAYARSLNVSQTGAAAAIGATGRYGVVGSPKNVEKLYGLEKSTMIKDYREAAMIMSLAGTSFGDRAAEQFSKKYEADKRSDDSGAAGTSGSFEFEWEALKGSGKEAMIHIFEGRDIKYGKALTDTMMDISNWTNANRDFLGTGFDVVAKSLKAFYTVLKVVLPAMAAFSVYFVATNTYKIFAWALQGVGTAATGMVKHLMTARAVLGTAGSSGTLTWAVSGLAAGLTALIPGVIAVGAAFGVWKIGKWIYDVYEFNKALKEARGLTEKIIAGMSESEADAAVHKHSKMLVAIKAELKQMESQRAQLIVTQGKNSLSKGYTESMSLAPEIQTLNDRITKKEKEKTDLLNKNKELTGKQANALGLTLPENVASVQEWISGLKRVNSELGFMPEQLLAINRAFRKNDLKGLEAAVGAPMAAAMQAKADFKDMMSNKAAVAGEHSIAKTNASLAANKFSVHEAKAFDLRANRDNMKDEMASLPKSSERHQFLGNAITGIDMQLKDLDTKNGTDNINKIATSLYGLQDAIKQMDMTSFDKKIHAIGKMDGTTQQKASLLEAEKEILTNKLQKKYLRMQGKNPDREAQEQNIKDSKLSNAMKTRYLDHLSDKDKLRELEIKLNIEQEKGLEYETKRSILLARDIKNLKTKDRWKNLQKGSKKSYNTALGFNNRKTTSELKLLEYSQDLLSGNIESENQGFLSETEANAKKDTVLKKLFRKIEAMDPLRYTPKTKSILKGTVRQNQDRKLKEDMSQSFLAFSSTTDKATNRGMSAKTEQAKKDLVTSNADTMRNRNIKGVNDYERSAYFAIDQDKLSVNFEAWEQYYSDHKVMTAEHYENEKAIIQEHYAANKTKMDEHKAELLRIEEEYQNKKKNRRALPLSDDMAVAGGTAIKSLTDSYQTFGEMAEGVMTTAFNGTANALTSVIMGTKDLKDAFKSMAASIVTDLFQMIIKQEMFNMLIGSQGVPSKGGGWLVQGLSSLGSSMFATGGVSRGISDYSNQVVSTPTFVAGGSRVTAYATGGSLFGEAGPEGILPLQRMPGTGNLGVEASGMGGGGGVNIEIRIENNGSAVDAKQKRPVKWDSSQNKFICGVVLEAATKNTGNFRTVLKGSLSV